MVMLSKLLHFRLRDRSGREYALNDLAVALLESDYPAVTHVLFENSDRDPKMLSWDAVDKIDWHRSRIDIANFDAAESVASDSLGEKVLLRRDVIDALVLDLHNRRATRANDLWLEEENGQLLLKAADTTAWAVLRRLSRGFFGNKASRAPYDWKYIEFLRGDAHAVKNGAGYHMRIQRLPPGEIAGLSSALPYLHAAELLTLLPDPIASDTLEAMTPERQMQVFNELDDDQALRLLAIMAPDDAADLLGGLIPAITKSLLERLPKVRSDALVELLRYPKDTVGGIMTNDVVTLPLHLTIQEARLVLRERLREPDFTYFIYIVENDATRTLHGTTSLRQIFVADDEQRLDEIVNPYIATLDPLEAADIGAYRVLNSHLAALPVIGHEKQLLGIVTVDAAAMQVAPPSWAGQAPKIFS